MTDHSRRPTTSDRLEAYQRAREMPVAELKREEHELRNKRFLGLHEAMALGVAREVLMGLGVQLPPMWK